MSDIIIKDLWQVKDQIAREHGYDIEKLVAHLQVKERSANRPIVDLSAKREAAKKEASVDAGPLHP